MKIMKTFSYAYSYFNFNYNITKEIQLISNLK